MSDHVALAAMLPSYVNASLAPAEHAEVDQHLVDCPACASELAAWQTIADAVGSAESAHAPPESILAAALEQIDVEDQPAAGTTRRSPSGRAGRNPWLGRDSVLRRTAVAAAVALVLVVVVVPAVRAPDLGEVLLVAEAETTAAGTASLQLDGQASVVLESSPASAGQEARVALTIGGDGGVRFGEALQARVRTAGDVQRLEDLASELEVLRTPTGSYQRTDTGPWEPTPAPSSGALGLAMLDPSMPEVLLGSATGPIEEIGADTVNGAPTRRLRFDLDDTTWPAQPGMLLDHRAEVWIGADDHLLRKVRIIADGQGTQPLPGQWHITLDVTLTDFGQPVDIAGPPTTDIR